MRTLKHLALVVGGLAAIRFAVGAPWWIDLPMTVAGGLLLRWWVLDEERASS